jgi:hypothetical protein
VPASGIGCMWVAIWLPPFSECLRRSRARTCVVVECPPRCLFISTGLTRCLPGRGLSRLPERLRTVRRPSLCERCSRRPRQLLCTRPELANLPGRANLADPLRATKVTRNARSQVDVRAAERARLGECFSSRTLAPTSITLGGPSGRVQLGAAVAWRWWSWCWQARWLAAPVSASTSPRTQRSYNRPLIRRSMQ